MNFSKIFALAFSVLCFSYSHAQLNEKQLDDLINKSRQTFKVPGISVGILKDGKIIYEKGSGVRSLKTNQPMDSHTLVGIASNSKGFTCVALAMMVDEGKLSWDDPVIKYIPEFKMPEEWVTKNFTIRDLVTHRSGLGLGKGDLMFFPEGGNFTTDDIIHNLQFLKTSSSFRTKLEYNNIMFIVAGEVLKRVSGKSWNDFIQQRILTPVGMVNSAPDYNTASKENIIDAHAPVDGKIVPIPHDWNTVANPAGGIMSNIPDMLTWAKFLLAGGVTEKGERLISTSQLYELWSLQMPRPVSPNNLYSTHFNGYGLGWYISDVKGYKQVMHTGGLLGTVTQFTLIPQLKLAIVVLTNQQSGAAFSAITNSIKDSYLGLENRRWVDMYSKRMTNYFRMNDSIKTAVFSKTMSPDKSSIENIVGTYTDSWWGEVDIKTEGNGKLRIASKRSPYLKGQLLKYDANTYVVKWDNRSYDADVFLKVKRDARQNVQSFKMTPIAPITDFSFDFDDLELVRKK